MKKLFGALLALVSSVALATTTVPVQLLNPTGSSSGQAIVSTGASSAPAWGNVAATSLAAQAANTVVANVTAASASPTAVALPTGCNTATSALNYATGSFTCNTSINAATLSGNVIGSSGATVPLLNGTNTWSGAQTFTSTITPSQTAGIVGTTTTNNANAGSVGEYITATTTSLSLSATTPTNLVSISLTAGDWEVGGNVVFAAGAGTATNNAFSSITTTSATLNADPDRGVENGWTMATGSTFNQIPPTQRISLSATTTVYLVVQTTFSGGTMLSSGRIRARRVR